LSQRVLVVDDDKQIVRLLRAYLERDGFEVLEAYDGEAALHSIRRERPDLVVLDLMLPLRDGRDVARVVRGDPDISQVAILMLTARISSSDKIAGLELGADDYVVKPFEPAEVVARVRAILRRTSGEPAQSTVLSAGPLRLDVDRHEVTVDGEVVDLTPTEFEMLHTLMRAPGRAFTRSDLLEGAADVAYAGMERTVDSHIKNLRRKVENDPRRPQLIQTVYGVGYRLRGDS
jgi:two-component system alkaline phosphatase synthesis response regulator PhoP